MKGVAGSAIALVVLWAWTVSAQEAGSDGTVADDTPIVRTDFPETETTPGQFLSLRVTVLVPTFMPDPPVWPSLEAPNLLVRLPERSTNPTSETIDGATWSGVTRHYRISPMVPGDFSIPAQDLVVTWSPDGGGDPVKSTLTMEPVAFRGTVPQGAEGVDPFIAATNLDLTAAVDGAPDAMVAGDSFTLTVTAQVEGVSPMFLPSLLAVPDVSGLAAYPTDPVITETEERGRVGGTRVERVTFVAEGGGGGSIPALALDWFNVSSGEVETATTEPVTIRIDGPPPSTGEETPVDARRIGVVAAGALALALCVVALRRRLIPWVRQRILARRDAYRATEAYAWRALQRTIAAQDAQRMRAALDLWARRLDGPPPRSAPEVSAALLELGAAHYGTRPDQAPGSAAWDRLRKALTAHRRQVHRRVPGRDLPPLNPRHGV